MAALGSVGIGSGVLTSDILDQLKDAEKSTIINPIDKSIETNSQKKEALDLLSSLTSTLKSSAFAMKDSSLYQKREVANTSEDVEVTAKDGVRLQEFSISDVKLAQKNVIQSGSFSSEDSKVASGDGTLNLNIDGTDYKIEYTANTSYDDLKTKINDIAGDGVTASILQTGDEEYRLIITSDETGKDQQIGLVDLSGNLDDSLKSDIYKSDVFDKKTDEIASDAGTLTIKTAGGDTTFKYDSTTTLQQLADKINTNDNDGSNGNADSSENVYASVVEDENGKFSLVLTAKNPAEDDSDITIEDNSGNLDTKLVSGVDGSATNDDGDISDIQTARDASFKYNNISMTRSSNTIDDIQLGLEIKLLKDDADANISITQDTQQLKDELQTFTDSFNSMQKQLDAMTLADLDAGKVGVFNGNNSINSIGRSLKKLLTERDVESGLALANFGLEVDRTGKLKFDSSVLDKKLKEDPEAVANYFSGKTDVKSIGLVNEIDGLEGTNTVTSGKFNSEDSPITPVGGVGKMMISLDDGTTTDEYSILYNHNTSLEDLKDKINNLKNENGDQVLEASIEEVTETVNGAEVTKYQLKIDKKEAGDQEISISDDPVSVTNRNDGVFEKLYNNLKGLNTLGGTILSLNDGLSHEGKQLEENRTKSLLSLNARYDTMTSRFIQYDSMINSLNNSFAALEQQIAMSVNGG